MKYKLLLFTLILASALFPADLDDYYRQMLSAYGNLASWQADIAQTNFFKAADTKLESEGKIFYQKGRISIRYNKPGEQFLLVEDGRVTIYDKSSNTAARMKLTPALQSLDPQAVIRKYWEKSSKTMTKGRNNTVTITLKPPPNEQFKQIGFNLDSRTGYISQLSYIDLEANTVTVRFSNIKVNRRIPASVWKLPIPPGVRIMDF